MTISCRISNYHPKKSGQWAYGASAGCAIFGSIVQSLYTNLKTSGQLRSHLADVEEQANDLFLRLVKDYASSEGVTEQLKAEEPVEWVRRMNNIRERALETVNAEVVFV